MKRGSLEVTPVGQWPVLHFIAWMQPSENMKPRARATTPGRSEEHTSELQSLMRISYAVFCLKKKKQKISTLYAGLRNKTPTKTKQQELTYHYTQPHNTPSTNKIKN